MEDSRHHLPPFVPDARYALPHYNHLHHQHHHHLLLRPEFDLPNVGSRGGGGAAASLEASSPRIYVPPHLPQDPRLGIPQQQHHPLQPPPPPLDFRTNGDRALDRLLLRREAHPDFRDFYPLDSPKFGGILREDPRNWDPPAPSPVADPFFEPRTIGRERLPVESRLGPPRARIEDGVSRGKRNRVVDEFVDDDGVRYFRVSSSDSHGVPAKSPANHGYHKGYKDDRGFDEQFGRHPSNVSAGKGKKIVAGGNLYNSHKVSVPNLKKKMKTGVGNGKRANFDQEPRKGSASAEQSQDKEDEKLGVGDSVARNPVNLDVSFKSNALVAKEILVAPQEQSTSSSKAVVPKKKIIKRKVKKPKQAASHVLGTKVASVHKKNAEDRGPSNNRHAVVMDSTKNDLCNSSTSATLLSEHAVIVKGSESLDLGNGRGAISGPDGHVKLLVVDSEKEGGCILNVGELCPKSAESGKKADILISLTCSNDNPLNSSDKQCGDTICKKREKESDGTTPLQPLSKEVKASILEENPPSELADGVVCDILIKTDSDESRQISEGPVPSLQNNSGNSHFVSMTSERSISEKNCAAATINPLNSETLTCDSVDKIQPDYTSPPVKKLKTNNGTTLVANTVALDSLLKIPHVEIEDNSMRKRVLTEHTVPDVILPSSSQTAGELMSKDSKPTGVALPSLLKAVSQPTAKPKTVRESDNKKLPGTIVPASLPQPVLFQSPPLRKSNKAVSAVRTMGSRTWHRTDNTANPGSSGQQVFSQGNPLGKQSLKKQDVYSKTSYVRKGNTLVRKSTPVGASPVGSPSLGLALNHSQVNAKYSLANGPHDRGDSVISKSVGFKNKVKAVSSLAKENGGKITPIERPDTPPLAQVAKLPVNSPQSSPLPESLEPSPETGLAISTSLVLDLIKQNGDLESNSMKVSDNQNNCLAMATDYEGRRNMHSKNTTLESKQMTYVKTKVNQLIATSKPVCHGSSSKTAENSQAPAGTLPSELYYKKNKNQLVRDATASESHSLQAIVITDDGSNSEEKGSLTLPSQELPSFIKRETNRISKAQSKPLKTLKMWKWSGIRSRPREYISSEKRWVLPSLVPWKRMTYNTFYGRSILSGPVKNSMPMIRRKLQLSRKRHTLYTRSGNGFSLHKSAVLSVGGRSLKWSKSIEKRSKQAFEEATLAFAAVEKEKRKKSSGAVAKAVKHASRKSACGVELQPGERIFRVGSFRYKMDSSKRTLLRIPDESASRSINNLPETDTKLSFVPRRLLIGNNEYIRIANGNKLVRDPKRLTRMLASEKVKWSLYTVRSRLARKRQYCQFFTRFGKCNKDDGKCPYIHDPDKVAVCTKFLKGTCFNKNCKLTHKVIPERMPDCSFFLQGLCSNESCPYRHVNVNPAASTCDGFLKGYCADGDECDKKHSYTCPQYQSTGICTQRSTCKLHHPKKKDKPGKQLRQKDWKKTRGRYFGSKLHDVGKSGTAVSKKQSTEQASQDAFISHGKFADYISLDINDDDDDDEAAQPSNLWGIDLETSIHDFALDSPKPDLDMVIKPIRLMQKSAA